VWPEERLEEKRLEKVSAGQAGLWQLTYMCDPVVAEGAMFKRDWLKDIHASPPEGLIVVQAVDPAIGMTKRADSTVIATVGLDLKARRFHVLDIYHDQLEGPDQPAAIAKQYEKWQPYTVGIESIFYQAALFQTVYREGSTRVSKIERRSGAGGIPKMMRMMGLAVRYKEQQVIHPISAPWLEDYEVELMSIQYIDGKGIHKHEDRADAVEMCIQLLSPLITTGATPQEPIYSDVTVRT